MSQEPKPSQSPPAKQAESLEDAIYSTSVVGNNTALGRTNPLVAVPTALVTYVGVAALVYFIATGTEAGQKLIGKTGGEEVIDISLKDDVEDLPPPPPAPPPPTVAPTRVEIKDQPPPPPITDQEVIPDAAPTQISTVDYSKIYAAQQDTSSSSGGIGSVAQTGVGTQQGSTTQNVVQEITGGQVVRTNNPPQPPYPAMAKRARVQGKVLVQITIGVDGVPISAKAVSGPPLLHEHAVAYAMKFRFRPYMIGDVAHQGRFNLELDFKIN